MKIFENRTISLGLVFAGSLIFAPAVNAQQSPDAAFLLTNDRDSIVLDVLVENPDVTVFDLMIPVGALGNAQAFLNDCTSGVFGSHVGGCNIADGEFRMVVFSPQNATLPSGTIGKFRLPGIELDASDIRIRAYDDRGQELDAEVLVDVVTSKRGSKDRISPVVRRPDSNNEIQ